MFYEKEGILESYNTTRHNDDYKNFLIIATIDKHNELSNNEMLLSLIRWTKKVKESIHQEDVGFVINSGNIFVILHKDRVQSFTENMKHVHVSKEDKTYTVISDILELKSRESSLIMRDSK